MINENQTCKMVTLLKSLKNVLIFRIHIPEKIVKSEDGFSTFFNDFNKVTILHV